MESPSSYLSQRQTLERYLSELTRWECVDHWPLLAGTRNIARFLYNISLLEQTIDIPGDIIELGSFRGSNAVLMAKILDYKYLCGKKIVVFDSFEGLTEFSPPDGKNTSLDRFSYKGSYPLFVEVLKLYQLEHMFEFNIGFIEDTVPSFVKNSAWRSFSLIYFDADLYTAAKSSLECLWSKLSIGGLFVFDEWNTERFPGEAQAVQEFFTSRSDFVHHQPKYSIQPSLVIKKIS